MKVHKMGSSGAMLSAQVNPDIYSFIEKTAKSRKMTVAKYLREIIYANEEVAAWLDEQNITASEGELYKVIID